MLNKIKMNYNEKTEEFTANLPSDFITENRELQTLVKELNSSRPLEEQQQIIRKLANNLLGNDDVKIYTAKILSYMFLTISVSCSLKKTLWRILTNANTDVVQQGMLYSIKYIIEGTSSETDSITLCINRANILVNFMSCFENIPVAIKALSQAIDVIIPFTVEQYVQLATLNNSDTKDLKQDVINNYLMISCKFLLCLIQQCHLDGKLKKLSGNLLKHSQSIVLNENLPLEIRANCAHIMTAVIDYLPKLEKTNFTFKVYPCLELLKEDNVCQYDVSTNLTAMMCVYSAIVYNVPEEVLCETLYNDKPVIVHIYNELISLARIFSGSPGQIIIISRAFTNLTKMLNGMSLIMVEPMFSDGLEYVSIFLDHFVENVRQSTKIVFQNFTKLAVKHLKAGNSLLFKMIQLSIWDLLLKRHAHYKYLTILSGEIDVDFLLETFEKLPYLLLNNLDVDETIAAEVCGTYECLMEQHAKRETGNVDRWIETWLEPVIKLLENDDDNNVSYCQRIIKSSFLLQPVCIKKFIHFQYSNKPNELGTLIECLRAARKKNIHICYKRPVSNYWRNYLEYNMIDTMMCHQSDEVRMSLLGLIVETHKSTEIFTSYELNFLKKFFYYNVTTQEGYVRQEMLALYKKAITRMKNGYTMLKRNNDNNVTEYESFYETFIKCYLKNGINTKDANVYRRSVCLELLVFTSEMIPVVIWNNCWDEEDLRYLYDLFDDSYESTLVLALKLINKLNIGGHQRKFHVNADDAFKNCLKSACSIQPSETTKAAYSMLICLQDPDVIEVLLKSSCEDVKYKNVYELAIFILLQQLSDYLNMAETNLKEGIAIQPFYGLILVIRYIICYAENSKILEWEIIIDTIFNLCQRMSAIVGPIISNSSPEGFVPDEFQSNEEPLAQKVLLFGWRSTKEMSLLIGEIMDKIPISDPNQNKYIFSNDFISKTEAYFLKLFFETKHRGAFEQAYVGFCKLCKKLWEASQTGYQCFPEYWLNNVLNMLDDNVENESTYSKLCATRRSAGLPFMIQAILVSQPKNHQSKIFSNCMEKLLSIAENDASKARTHSLNILRALYRHNQLNEKVVPYISRGFIVSINGFDDSSWAIRNSSTLLFSALITRTFGVQRTKDVEDVSIKNKLSSRVFFTRYTGLYNFLLNKMIEFEQPANSNQLSIHPVLLILSRLYASNVEEEKHLVDFLPYVSHCLTLPPYRIRKLAAKATTCIIPKNYVVPYIIILLMRLSDMRITNNYCDAVLLQLNFLLSNKVPEIEEKFLPKLIEKTFWIFMCAGHFTSHFTGSLYFDVIAAFVTKYNTNCYGSEVFKNLGRLLLVQTIYDEERDKYKFLLQNHLMTSKRTFNRNRYFLHIYLVTTVYDCSDDVIKANYIKQFLFNGLSSEMPEIIEFTLDYLIYVGFQSPIHKLHALYLNDELEICEYAKQAVDNLTENLREELLIALNVINPEFLQIISNLIHKNQIIRYQIFLLLYEYPCLLFKAHQNYVNVMNFLISYLFKDSDILYCAVLGCISRILESIIDVNGCRPFNMGPLIKILEATAMPNASSIKKLTLAQLMVANKNLLLYQNNVLYDEERIVLWNVVICLLDDYDFIVRDTTSQLVTKDVTTANTKCEIGLDLIPEKSKELLVHGIPYALDSSSAIRLLISWSLNARKNLFSDTKCTCNSNEIFKTIDDNPYYESEPLVEFALDALRKYLWTLDNGLSYDDYSIFLEEHLLLIATKVQNAIEHKVSVPRVGNAIRLVLRKIIEKMIEFLELIDIGKSNFKRDLKSQLEKVLQTNVYDNEVNIEMCKRLKQLVHVIFGI